MSQVLCAQLTTRTRTTSNHGDAPKKNELWRVQTRLNGMPFGTSPLNDRPTLYPLTGGTVAGVHREHGSGGDTIKPILCRNYFYWRT